MTLTRPTRRLIWLLGLALLAAALAGAGCLTPPGFDEQAWRDQVAAQDPAALRAPHRDPETGAFFNPWNRQEKPWWDLWRWFLSADSAPEDIPDQPVPVVANSGEYLADPAAPPSLTWIGHASYALQWGGPVVVTDPFFGPRAAVVGRRAPPAFGPEKIPDGAVVVISHNHYDHLDAESVAALGPRVRFLCPLGLKGILEEMGAVQVIELDWWQSVEIEGARFTCLPAQHWSRRFGQGLNQSLWCAWLIERDGRRVFYGGDSGYFVGFKEFGRLWPGIDIALMPVGAYLPRWFMHYAHMDPAEVLAASRELGARVVVPTQWGVLELGDEPASWPAEALAQLAAQSDWRGRVVLLPVGGRMGLDGTPLPR
jgi:L-ascorbate metabolism protein UlaG (beta-lactamase superfamily)